MKKIFLIAAFLLTSTLAFAESMTMVTYYPAPFGSYDRLRLVPRLAAGMPVCDASTEGLMYYDKTDRQVKVCGASGFSGFGGVWTESNHMIFPTHTSTDPTLKVGIGTATPQGTLHLYREPGVAPKDIWYGNLTFFDDTQGEMTFDGGTDGLFTIVNTSALNSARTDFSANGNHLFTIKNDGNIGVGTASPAGILHVLGKNDTASVVTLMPGTDTGAAGTPSMNLGIGTTTPFFPLTIKGAPANTGGIFVEGQDGDAGALPALPANTTKAGKNYFIYYPYKSALRVGQIYDNGQWDEANIGDDSYAIGLNVSAPGHVATAFGDSMEVTGDYSMGISLYPYGNPRQILAQDNTMAIIGGKVGIGTLTPSAPLHIVENTTEAHNRSNSRLGEHVWFKAQGLSTAGDDGGAGGYDQGLLWMEYGSVYDDSVPNSDKAQAPIMVMADYDNPSRIYFMEIANVLNDSVHTELNPAYLSWVGLARGDFGGANAGVGQYDHPSADMSIMLGYNRATGATTGANLGINTLLPTQTLDLHGTMHMEPQNSAPLTCGSPAGNGKGVLFVKSSNGALCYCNGTSWYAMNVNGGAGCP